MVMNFKEHVKEIAQKAEWIKFTVHGQINTLYSPFEFGEDCVIGHMGKGGPIMILRFDAIDAANANERPGDPNFNRRIRPADR
jgi:hypothetical protein